MIGTLYCSVNLLHDDDDDDDDDDDHRDDDDDNNNNNSNNIIIIIIVGYLSRIILQYQVLLSRGSCKM